MERAVYVVGFPWEEKSTLRRGTALGPWAIRRELLDWFAVPTGLASKLPIVDLGVVKLSRDERAFSEMAAVVGRIVPHGVPVVLGGDHSLTLPTVRTVAAVHGPVRLLWIDRHADLYPDFLGDRYSHACTAARLLEAGAVRELVQLGVRETSEQEEIQRRRWNVVWESEPNPELLPGEGPVYVTVDLDVLDPSFAPGASQGMHGGWRPEELLELLSQIETEIVGFDVVELNPRLDTSRKTAKVAAEVVKTLVGKVAVPKGAVAL
ncbi:MAG: arginase family protein [Calditrichaeota bacterium]|nr:arginase family protein [Calditrichota bacterium]